MVYPTIPNRRRFKSVLILFGAVALHVFCVCPAQAQFPVLFSDPVDGGQFAGTLTLNFFQPMEDAIAIEFSGTGGVEFDCTWQGPDFPGLPKLSLMCRPNGTLPPGAIVTWTINPEGTGFTTVSGEVLPTTSGSFRVAGTSTGGGGGNRGGSMPECPIDAVSLPFPKAVAVCGGLLPWQQAALLPRGTGYVLTAFMGDGMTTRDTLILLDSDGYVLAKALAPDTQTRLDWTADSDFLFAHRMTPSGDALTLGLYNGLDGFSPVYEKTLALDSPNTHASLFPDGGGAIVQDLSTEIEVIRLSQTGDVSWALQYRSPLFGADGPPGVPGNLPVDIPGLGPNQQVSLHGLPEGYLLAVIKSEQSFVGFTPETSHTLILVRLDGSGAVSWAKTYRGFDTSSAPIVSITRDGSIFLRAFDTQIEDLFNPVPKFSSLLVRLNPAGEMLWGKRIPDVTIGVLHGLPGGSFLLSGSLIDSVTSMTQAVFVTLDGNGNLMRQVLVDAGAATSGFAFPGENRIWYTLVVGPPPIFGTEGPTQDAIIGSSSIALEDWQWRQYTRLIHSASLLPNDNGTDFVFSAFYRDTHALDLVGLDGNLNGEAPCELFLPVDVGVTALSLNPTSISVQVANASVTAMGLSPSFTAGNIPLETFSCVERPICEGTFASP